MSTEAKLTEKVSKDLMDQLVKLALDLGEINKVDLDFTHDSIRDVEQILSHIHADYLKKGMQEGMKGIALECAAYIVKTIKNNTGSGEWFRNDREFGKDSFPFEWKNGDVLFPYSWCQKRIFDGPSDDVWLKYQTLVLSKI